MIIDGMFWGIDVYSNQFEEELGHVHRVKAVDFNDEIRFETIRRQLGIKPRIDYGCVTVESCDGELLDDYDLCEHCD